jgi:ubiquinone/menaquinone biosynthesis C-methylase UbiE
MLPPRPRSYITDPVSHRVVFEVDQLRLFCPLTRAWHERFFSAVAKKQIKAENVKFQLEDCQKTSLPDGAFDTAFMSLVIHFTEPEKTLAEMRRLLKPGGTLIITNLDPGALDRLNRIRCWARVIYNGLARYRVKPPKEFAVHLLTEEQLCGLLRKSGFKVLGQETISDTSRSSNIPVEYIRAVKI